MPHTIDIAVLGGGPDAEREVSLVSSQAVADALAKNPRFRVTRHVIGRLSLPELQAIPGEVVFPVLHGPWGEGGPLQDLLELDGRAYVGCRPRAARLAMDKLATKLAAHRVGVAAAPATVFNALDPGCPLDLPVVVKPIHEGSSVGVHICRTGEDWSRAHRSVIEDTRKHPHRVYMVEKGILGGEGRGSGASGGRGRELTCGVLDGVALPPIEIVPKAAFYDYEAKYHSDETVYVVDPELPKGVREVVRGNAVKLCRELGVRHLARVDFIVDEGGTAWMLEANTMPGFTSHSLLPMSAADSKVGPGLDMAALTTRLVEMALRDKPTR